MALSKKNDPIRKWRSLQRHLWLVAKTLTLAGMTTILWYQIWIRGYHFSEDDKDNVIAIVGVIGVIYGIQMSWMLPSLLEKYNKIVISVFKKDQDTFLFYRDERMPIVLHLLIGIVAIPFLGVIGTAPYKHAPIGAISVFVAAGMLIFFWFVAAQLEDPLKSPWIRERIPEEWSTIDIDVHFKLGAIAKVHHSSKA